MLRGCLRTDFSLRSVYKSEYARPRSQSITLGAETWSELTLETAASVSEHRSQASSYAMRPLVSRKIHSIREYDALEWCVRISNHYMKRVEACPQ
jgi:hypothetical protein